MKVHEVLEGKRRASRVSYAEIARRVGMNSGAVTQAFNGLSDLQAIQFLRICRVLELTKSDFSEPD